MRTAAPRKATDSRRRPPAPAGRGKRLPAAALGRFRSLLRTEAQSRWAIGDALIELVDVHRVPIAVLAAWSTRKRSTLSSYYHTSRTFAAADRDADVCWNHFDNARRVARRFGLQPGACVREIVDLGLTQRRDVTRHFADLRRRADAAKALSATPAVPPATLVNACHNADCRLIAQALPPTSTKIAVLDLPYGTYQGYHPGRHDPGAVARTDCDGDDEGDVVELLTDLLALLPARMAPGGAALLFRPGGVIDPFHGAIAGAADGGGWEVRHRLTWDKGRTKLGRPNAPYAPRTESIYVLALRGQELANHDGSQLDDLLRFPVPRYTSAAASDHHLFAKPLDLCRFLISKHSHRGELVFDACGCSGNFCIAAAELGRLWVYCETNASNFAWGSTRIAAAVARAHRVSA